MTEIDFDELDKAVNSIMSGRKPQTPARPAEAASPATTNTGASAGSTDISPAVQPTTVSRSQEPSRPATSSKAADRTQSVTIPARRSGRFMDVVHPSSNMKPTSTVSRNVSRNAGTLEPLDHVSHTPNLEELNALLSDESPSAQTVASEPIATPFISDAKVEKRPLGGATQAAMSSSSRKETASDDPQRSPAQPVKAVVMPAELTPDLLSIESGDSEDESADVPVKVDDSVQSVPVTKLDTTPAPTPEPAQRSEQSSQQKEDEKPVSDTKTATPAKADTQPGIGPIAIQQQYSQEPSTSPAESGAIYDTDSYHQPLVHVEKKKSGWMWVVWIVLLLILGASGGAAAYFLLLQ